MANLNIKSNIHIQLPNEITEIIWKHYYSSYVLLQIKHLRITKFNKIIKNIELQPNIRYISDLEKSSIWDLTDIGDFIAFNNEYKKVRTDNIDYHIMSIALPLERFYSLTLPEQEQHIQKAKKHKPKYSWQNSQRDYFEKQYMDYLDYKGLHSGSTFGYCVGNVSKYIMGTKEEQLEQWISFIKAYIIIRNEEYSNTS